MAETSVLTSAHNHAQLAAREFAKSHFAPATTQHEQAAAEFARASKSTTDHEALRVLKLLEEQHQRLARIIKSRDAPENSPTPESVGSKEPPQPSKVEDAKVAKSKPKPTTSALASTRMGSSVRDSSPSLARDIASRRGIPPAGRNPTIASGQAKVRQLSPESGRKPAVTTSKVPPSIMDSQTIIAQATKTKAAEDDEGFAKFYNNLTTGTMSKLSSVLAYAGLPLTAEDAVNHEQAEKNKVEKRFTVKASNDPDVKKLFSRAALDAIEDEHRQRGTLGQGFGPTESFYVVQTGGGTYSYADIAKAQQQKPGDDDDDPEFVDAKEVPGPSSPKRSRISSRANRSSFGKPRTQEELELENSTLKSTLEQLAGRLANFEAHAQDASMAMLTQSMIGFKPSSSGEPRRGPVDDAGLKERLRQLETKVEESTESEQKMRTLAEKQSRELKKYRQRFEELKKGARERDRLKQEKRESFDPGDGVAGD